MDAAAQKKTPEDTAPAPEPELAPICVECWPTGWPDASHSASCVHGEWLNDTTK